MSWLTCISELPQCVESAPTFFFLIVFLLLIVWKGLTPLVGGVLLILGGLAKPDSQNASGVAKYELRLFGQHFKMSANGRNAAIGAGILLAAIGALAPSWSIVHEPGQAPATTSQK